MAYRASPLRTPTLVTAATLLSGLLASPAAAQLPAGTWQYLWGDEFTLDSLDGGKWSHNYPWGSTHNHDAYMDPGNVVLGDGTLTLVARRAALGGKPFTSGAVSTGYSRFTVNGGYVEARIRLPDTPGSWPAFWGLYSGWPPEADIMEYPIDTAAGSGYAQTEYHTAFHYRNASGGNSAGAGKVNPASAGDLGGAYHNFGMEWREDDWVGFYFDGQLVSQFGDDPAVAQMQQMYLILNYAVGGWPGTPSLAEWPAGHADEMKVDWVRVWKQAAARTTSWAYAGASEYVLWDTAGNWSNGSPNLGGVTASFGTVAGVAEQRLDWTGIRTLTAVNLDGSTRYRLGWPDDRLILAGANNASGSAAINVAATSTIDHEVRAGLELFSTLAISNASGRPFTLSGRIFGTGGVTVDGPGVVVFAGADNAYVGSTTIDGGAQGPGVARVAASNAFGSGDVSIGPGGNATTARLELTNDSAIPNAVHFSGRNNASVGIENVGGNNTLAGTVHLQVGGSSYVIQSDAGLLTLSGSAGGGVALRSLASGARTVRLQGAGAGQVTGRIQDGPAAALGIVKLGAGTWSLTADNAYTGPTTVGAGTLRVSGSIAGSTRVSVGGTGTFEAAATQSLKSAEVAAGGTVRIAPVAAGSAARRLTVGDGTHTFAGAATSALSIAGGRVDVSNGALVVRFAPGSGNAAAAAVRGQIASARGGAAGGGAMTWQGPGITADAAIADPANRAVGYALSSDLFGPAGGPFMGAPVDGSSVLVRMTAYGDATLDGRIDADDYARADLGFLTGGPAKWAAGDFNYDGRTDVADYYLIDRAYARQGAAASAAPLAAVPEPASASLLACGTLALLRRRRRHGPVARRRFTSSPRTPPSR